MTPKQILQMIKDKGATSVDLKFMDLLGQWQHFSTPISEFQDESPFEEGLGFDGSSIRGWQAIDTSDMLVIPDPNTRGDGALHQRAHPHPDLQHRRPDYPRRLLAATRATSRARPRRT